MLEDFLTNIFYGSNGSTLLHNVTQIYEQMFNKNFGELSSWSNLSNVSASSESDADQITAILTQQAGEYKHIAQIKKQTLINRRNNLNALKQEIEVTLKNGDLDELSKILYRDLWVEVDRVFNAYKDYLQAPEIQGLNSNQYITAKRLDALFAQIDNLDKAYTGFIRKMDILPSDIGNLFELALVLISDYGQQIVEEEVGEEAIQYFAKQMETSSRWKGPKTFARSGLDLSSVISVKYDSFIKQKKGNILSVSIPTGDESGLRLYTEFQTKFDSTKQGKADVIFTLPNTSETFSISAKNWSNLFLSLKSGQFIIQDFGNTTLAAALSRSNISSLAFEHWLYALGPREASGSQLQAAHMLAQVAIGADILMGYSQKKGAIANTIVINNRKAKRIQVLSVMELLEDIDKEISDRVSISNYNSQTIRAEAKYRFSDVKSWRTVGSNFYKGSLISYINNVHVSIKINPFL